MSDARGATPELVAAIVREAARAPSAHNVQPARWGIRRDDGAIALLRDPSRSLPVADPTRRDEQASLGAALEGFAIAASTHGLAVQEVRRGADAHHALGRCTVGPYAVEATVTLRPGAGADPLAAHVSRRRSWRGPFTNGAGTAQALEALRRSTESGHVRLLGGEHAAMLAREVDAAMWAFERQPAYHAEMWRWLRLDPRDPAYRRDGLTADALLLSAIERTAGQVLLRPRVFRALQLTGLGRHLLSEGAATRSAAAFICYCPPGGLDAFDTGRGMYRLWLAATAAGLVLAPMSVLVDHERSRARLRTLLALGPESQLVQVFRAGTIDGVPPESPRLPPGELLLVL